MWFTFSLSFASLIKCWHLYPILFQSVRYGQFNNMSHLNMAAPGEEPKIVWWVKQWWVEQTAQAAFMMNCSMSLGSMLCLPSYSAGQSILTITPCRHSKTARTNTRCHASGLSAHPSKESWRQSWKLQDHYKVVIPWGMLARLDQRTSDSKSVSSVCHYKVLC